MDCVIGLLRITIQLSPSGLAQNVILKLIVCVVFEGTRDGTDRDGAAATIDGLNSRNGCGMAFKTAALPIWHNRHFSRSF
jgi:hypothetical protein